METLTAIGSVGREAASGEEALTRLRTYLRNETARVVSYTSTESSAVPVKGAEEVSAGVRTKTRREG
jgi:hypothetical protein